MRWRPASRRRPRLALSRDRQDFAAPDPRGRRPGALPTSRPLGPLRAARVDLRSLGAPRPCRCAAAARADRARSPLRTSNCAAPRIERDGARLLRELLARGASTRGAAGGRSAREIVRCGVDVAAFARVRPRRRSRRGGLLFAGRISPRRVSTSRARPRHDRSEPLTLTVAGPAREPAYRDAFRRWPPSSGLESRVSLARRGPAVGDPPPPRHARRPGLPVDRRRDLRARAPRGHGGGAARRHQCAGRSA